MENKVGQVNFEVRADTSKVAGDMDAARTQVQAQAEKIIPPVQPNTPDLYDVNREQQKDIGYMRSRLAMFGAVSAAGVAAGAAIAKAWDHFFTSGTEKAERFKESLDFTDTAGSLKKTADEYQRVANDLSKAMSGDVLDSINTFLDGNSVEKLKEQLEVLRRSLKAQKDFADAKEKRDKEAKEAELTKIEVEATQKRIEAARIAMMDGQEKIQAQAIRDRKLLQDKIDGTKDEGLKAALTEESALRYQQMERELAAYRMAEQEKKRLSDERQRDEERKAKEYWQDYVRTAAQAQREVRDQNNQMFGAGNVDANSGNVNLILTTLSAQMAGITDSLVQSVKTSPYE